ncbi:hypothetical protein OAT84_00385 [Gammaproteobacteria bacterium]|nr:hypothetical protein [Gammaproteobacteria bacterium]
MDEKQYFKGFVISCALICPQALTKSIKIENNTSCILTQQFQIAHSTALDLPNEIAPGETATGYFNFTQGWITNPLQSAQVEYLATCGTSLEKVSIELFVDKSPQDSLEHYLNASTDGSNSLIVFPFHKTAIKEQSDIQISLHSPQYNVSNDNLSTPTVTEKD